jgi:hypothetical protein
VSKEFRKRFVNALVKVSKQEFSRLETEFTFSVTKKNSGDEASALHIFAKANSSSACAEIYTGSDTI